MRGQAPTHAGHGNAGGRRQIPVRHVRMRPDHRESGGRIETSGVPRPHPRGAMALRPTAPGKCRASMRGVAGHRAATTFIRATTSRFARGTRRNPTVKPCVLATPPCSRTASATRRPLDEPPRPKLRARGVKSTDSPHVVHRFVANSSQTCPQTYPQSLTPRGKTAPRASVVMTGSIAPSLDGVVVLDSWRGARSDFPGPCFRRCRRSVIP